MRMRIPGPMCQYERWVDVEDGTLPRLPFAPAGALGAADLVPEPEDAPPVLITPEILQRIFPSLKSQASLLAYALSIAMSEAEIMTRLGQAMFLAQVAHESAGFTTMEEKGGKIKFSKDRFPNASKPDDNSYDYFHIMYDKDSPADNRREVARKLGNTDSGDGARYHGRGYLQLTGRGNYRAAGKDLGLDLEKDPELAAQPQNAARIAGWFWKTHSLNKYTHLDTDANFEAITKAINGGLNGLAERTKIFERAKDALGIGTAVQPDFDYILT